MSAVCPIVVSDPSKLLGEVCIREKSNFAKSFQFSPCGLLALSATEQDTAVVSSLQGEAVDCSRYYKHSTESNPVLESSASSLSHKCSIPIGESIYDLKWHPASTDAVHLFASTSRDHPIVLWDVGGEDGKGRMICSYRGYDQADELEAAISLSFNLTGDKVYAGSNRMIRLVIPLM